MNRKQESAEAIRATLHRALELGLEGTSPEEVQRLTGLNHSQYAWARYVLTYYCAKGGTEVEATPENVAALRKFYGLSIGHVMTLLGVAEDGLWKYGVQDVDKLYEQHTKLTIHGTRNGRGGAMLRNDPKLYEGALAKTGTDLERAAVNSPEARALAAAMTQCMSMEVPELRAMAEELELSVAKNATKAVLAKAVAEALA
jgi:hypothetical protein